MTDRWLDQFLGDPIGDATRAEVDVMHLTESGDVAPGLGGFSLDIDEDA